MIYPAYSSRIGSGGQCAAILPDFNAPGFSACVNADRLCDLPKNAQILIERLADSKEFEMPEPSDIKDLESAGCFHGGYWLLLDINTSSIDKRPVRLNVSLPASFVKCMDDFAASNKMTRSALIAVSVERYMDANSADEPF